MSESVIAFVKERDDTILWKMTNVIMFFDEHDNRIWWKKQTIVNKENTFFFISFESSFGSSESFIVLISSIDSFNTINRVDISFFSLGWYLLDYNRINWLQKILTKWNDFCNFCQELQFQLWAMKSVSKIPSLILNLIL